ncbi:hypothetical protein AAVH_06692 [Aphelenchoides avenae]|nr:hypothetical protein AAVH_06691 [Aphelenchus avenae]KAH7725849.1 hypothetical protein AAVH_06692 [Aphelenchus avenae]
MNIDLTLQAVILLGCVTVTNSVIVLLKCYIRRKRATTIEDCSSLTDASVVEKASTTTNTSADQKEPSEIVTRPNTRITIEDFGDCDSIGDAHSLRGFSLNSPSPMMFNLQPGYLLESPRRTTRYRSVSAETPRSARRPRQALSPYATDYPTPVVFIKP